MKQIRNRIKASGPVGKKISRKIRMKSIRPMLKPIRAARSAKTTKSGETWIELFPYAISMGPLQTRPVLIFRDQAENLNLPVWLNQIDASIAALDLSKNTNFHGLALKIFEAAGIRIERCDFVELQGHHQFVKLQISGHPKLKHMRVRADEAIPFCSAQKARFFSTQEFIMQCRDLDVALLGLEQSLNFQPEIGSKKQSYVM